MFSKIFDMAFKLPHSNNNLMQIKMFGNFGAAEIIIIVGVIALLFCAKRIPEIAKGIGKGIYDFKKEIKSLEDITK
jgi:sec-independent protein translocase protein TatA